MKKKSLSFKERQKKSARNKKKRLKELPVLLRLDKIAEYEIHDFCGSIVIGGFKKHIVFPV